MNEREDLECAQHEHAAKVGPDVAGIATDSGMAVEMKVERAPDPAPGELRKANRHERRAMAAQAKKDGKKFAEKKWTHKEAAADTDGPPIDLLGFLEEVTLALNEAVGKIEKARARVNAAQRLEAEPLGIVMQLAFMTGYMEAYTPKGRHNEMFARALSFKSKFKFRSNDGDLVKPKDEPLIVAPPPLIIPG